MEVSEKILELDLDISNSDSKFIEQIESYQEFKRQMDDAGVVQNKKSFTIPLFERIQSLNHSD